jgi:hypothetical protein
MRANVVTGKTRSSIAVAADSNILPRAIIPPFELTPPSDTVASREKYLIAKIEKLFGGRVVWGKAKNEFLEWGEPSEALFSSAQTWKKHVLPRPIENEGGELVLGDRAGPNQEQARFTLGLGLTGKAQRIACCGRFGRRIACLGAEPHPFYEPFNCGLRTCQRCAPLLARRLFERLSLLEMVVKERRGWTLAQLDFTLLNTGLMPDAEIIRAANRAVKRTMHRLLRGVKGWGFLWIDEFGFDNSNLHVHGIYYGPYLPIEEISSVWTKESGGSYRVWITKIRKGFRPALWHHLGYVSKPPSNDPRRLAEVEAAFHGVRKVHTLGAFYAPEFEDVTDLNAGGSQRCPRCNEYLVITSGYCAVSTLEAEGLRNVNDVRRAVFLQRMAAGPP